MSGSLARVVNRSVGIAQALRWCGCEVPDGCGTRKTWCPFGRESHGDGGVSAAMRVYEDDNHAHCFDCARSWTPVALMAEWWDCGWEEAAAAAAQLAGITEPDWRERWAELHREPEPDRDALAEALKTWCTRVRADWARSQFTPALARPLAECLALLPLVRSAPEAAQWLEGTKRVMLPVLRNDHQS